MNPTPTTLLRIAVGVGLCGVLAARLAAQETPPVAPGPVPPVDRAVNPYGFEVWHDDFPQPLVLPARNPAPVYQRSSRQALEQVARNLQGNTRRDVWLMAIEFFARAPEDAAPVLIEAMDRALGQRSLQDVVRNTIEAMGRMGGEEFDDSLRRAMEHPNVGVRQAAFSALATAGKAETLRRTQPLFLSGMDGRTKQAWLRAARKRLGSEMVPMFASLMVPETPIIIRDLVLEEVLQMPPSDGAEALTGIWEHAAGDFKATVASVLHAAGKTSGTLWLHNALTGDDPGLAVMALGKLKGRDFGVLREDVLRLSTNARPEIRFAVADALQGVPGDDVTRTYEVLAGPEELIETKSVALRELTRRGRTDAVTMLLDDVATSTGTKLQVQLRLLAASGDDRAVPIFRERFESAPETEGRQFLQSLATCGAPSAARALCELFLEEDRPISRPGEHGQQLTTVGYIPVLLPNLRGHEDELVGYWGRIPREDYRRRSLYLHALAGIAVDRADPAVRAQMLELLRGVLFDPDEVPQLRVQALNEMTRHLLDMDDVRRLRRLQESTNKRESRAMQALTKDFLFEYF